MKLKDGTQEILDKLSLLIDVEKNIIALEDEVDYENEEEKMGPTLYE